MHWIAFGLGTMGAFLCVSMSPTLCSACSITGGMSRLQCRSPGRTIHSWLVSVSTRLSMGGEGAFNFCLTRAIKCALLLGDISPSVVTNSSITSCRCLFQSKNGTWQYWGNNSADPDIRYACVSGTK